jgi:hypothetical protein
VGRTGRPAGAAQLVTRRPDLAETVRSGIERSQEPLHSYRGRGRKPLRAENEKLQAEVDRLRAENGELRAELAQLKLEHGRGAS